MTLSHLTQLTRRVISVVLVAIALLVNLVSAPASFAAPLTPEAAKYVIKKSDSAAEAGERLQAQAKDYKQELKEDSNYTAKAVGKAAEDSKNGLEKAVDTVVEKLNLNEPLPESTKEFLGEVEENVDKVVEPVVEGKPGFFKVDRTQK